MAAATSRLVEAPKPLACIFCGDGDGPVALRENGYEAVQCPNCGLIFVSPRPSATLVADLYRQDEAYVSAQSHIAGFGTLIGRLYARHALRQVRRYVTEGRFLEIGAGNGNVLAEARAAGFEAYGIELNPVQAQFIREHLDISCTASVEDLRARLPGVTFDVVYHCDVLSHFFDPIAEFERIHELLAPRGVHIFETGNLGDVKPHYFGLFHRFQLPDHLFFFSERAIDALLDRTGFQRVATHRYSILPQLVLISWLRRLRDRIRGPATAPGSGSRKVRMTPATARSRSVVRTLLGFVLFVVRYKCGAVARKQGRPQTMIVVACTIDEA
jgi:SAM-dependent methyltransferase